jgi:uncharacterized membrane protein YuzA (DUF378 family)
MHSKSTSPATLKRLFYILLGLAAALLGSFHPTIQGHTMPTWRAALVVLVGLFYVYVGTMYYFPSNRRKRKELDRLMDDAESDINEAESKTRHQP